MVGQCVGRPPEVPRIGLALTSDRVPYGVHGRATVDFYSSKVVGVGGSVLPFDLEVTPKAAKVEPVEPLLVLSTLIKHGI